MKKVFDEVKIKDLTLRNRFARSGTWMKLATEEGALTDEFFAYYEKMAKANLGFAMVGYSRVDKDEQANNKMVGMYDDKFIPDLKKLTDMFHANGTLVGIQIAMGGSQVHYKGDIKWKLLAPTETIMAPRQDSYGNTVTYTANEITKEEITEIIEKFADAALRVKQSGFDMVQIHGAHGYFLSQWLNKEINTRDDEYGQNRGKLLLDIYDAVRAKVGSDFKIGIKVNSEENINDHSNHDDILTLCVELDKRGIDLIEVSGTIPSRAKKMNDYEGYFKDFAKKLTEKVSCTTMLTGGFKTIENIEAILNDTNVDIIGFSRPLICETDLIHKFEKDSNYKAKCVSCNHCHAVTGICCIISDK